MPPEPFPDHGLRQGSLAGLQVGHGGQIFQVGEPEVPRPFQYLLPPSRRSTPRPGSSGDPSAADRRRSSNRAATSDWPFAPPCRRTGDRAAGPGRAGPPEIPSSSGGRPNTASRQRSSRRLFCNDSRYQTTGPPQEIRLQDANRLAELLLPIADAAAEAGSARRRNGAASRAANRSGARRSQLARIASSS